MLFKCVVKFFFISLYVQRSVICSCILCSCLWLWCFKKRFNDDDCLLLIITIITIIITIIIIVVVVIVIIIIVIIIIIIIIMNFVKVQSYYYDNCFLVIQMVSYYLLQYIPFFYQRIFIMKPFSVIIIQQVSN